MKEENEIRSSLKGHTTVGKEPRPISITMKKGRKGKANTKLFGPGTRLENEHHAVDESTTTTNNDHSTTTTDKTSITTADAHSSTNFDNKIGRLYPSKNENQHKDNNGLKDGKKAITTKKARGRKGKTITVEISGGIDPYAVENPSRRKRSEHKNNSTKSNKTHNNHKENDTEILVNNIIVSGIALQGVYFAACILLMTGISKVQN